MRTPVRTRMPSPASRRMRNPVSFQVQSDSLFVGSYTRVRVRIDGASRLTRKDLEFVVDPGPEAGVVSTSSERFGGSQSTILLAAGHKPGGGYALLARNAANGRVVGKLPFAVTATWADKRNGPSFWFAGAADRLRLRSFVWGGGQAGPQNIGVAPAVGRRKIAVVFINSPTERFSPQELPAVREQWRNEIVNGVADAAGRLRSLAHYYREVSYFGVGPTGIDFEADFYGPVTMPQTWDHYFDGRGWRFGSTWQSMVTEANSQVDFSAYKHVIFATKSTPSWPQADWGPPVYTTAQGDLSFGVLSMPYNWDILDGRRIHATASHELGHHLGMDDLYMEDTDVLAERRVGGWEIMDSEAGLPHFALADRMILGWVPSDWIQTFNFSIGSTLVNQIVELHPVELGNPPATRKIGVEVRIADGWNYYFEYRKPDPGQIGDQALPENNRVLGTDVASYNVYGNFMPPRPPVLLLPVGNGDGAVPRARRKVRGGRPFQSELAVGFCSGTAGGQR